MTPQVGLDLSQGFLDYATFCRECLKVRDLTGSVVALEPSPGQLALDEAIQRQWRKQKPVRLVVLKTRRSWFTTGSCAQMFHRIPFFPGTRGMVVADRYKPAGLEAFDYFLQFQRGYTPFSRHGHEIKLPTLIKDSEQEMRWDNGSSVEVLSADAGELRGGGRQWLLCDELAFWRAAGTTLTGLLNMVPYLPETGIIVQSTANGIGGEFYDLCQRAMDPANESGWEFLFFGWLDHPPYRMAIEGDPGKFARSLDREETELHQRFGATLEQLNWRRKTIATECRGSIDTFRQEYPANPQEAFLASGRPVFDQQALQRMPISQGESGELEMVEDGVLKRALFLPRERGALTIWSKPQPGRRYVCGADPSKGKDVSADQRGSDPDYSVGFIADADTGVQVALLRARIRPVAFAEYLALLCKWYNFAYLNPEANDAGFIDALVRTGYPLEMMYQRQRDPADRRPGRIEEIGFETTTLTRDWLVGAAEDAIRNMTITIRSSVVLNECIRFVIKPNGKKEHQDGSHDDCVLAMALCEIARRFIPKRSVMAAVGPAKIQQYGKRRVDDDD